MTSKKDAWEWAKKMNEGEKECKTIFFYRACGAFRMTPQLVMNFEVI